MAVLIVWRKAPGFNFDPSSLLLQSACSFAIVEMYIYS